MSYRFYIKKDDITFYYVDNDGDVVETTTPISLKYAPRGWENIGVEHNRSMILLGVFRSVATPIDFIEDGRQIAQYILYTQGIQGVGFVYIERQNDQNYNWEYYYNGQMDMSTALDHDFFLTVNLVESGAKKVLDDNMDKIYQVLIDPADPIIKHVYIDGLQMVDNAKWYPVTDSASIIKLGYLMPNTVNSQYAGDFKGGIAKDQNHGVLQNYKVGQSLQSEFYDLYFYQAAVDESVIFDIYSSFTKKTTNTTSPTAPAPVDVRLLIVGQDQVIKTSLVLGTYNDIAYNNTYSHILDTTTPTINLKENDRLYLVYGMDSTNAADTLLITIVANAIDSYTNYHALNVVFRLHPNNTMGYLYKDYANKLAQVMSGGAYGLRSDYLSNTSNISYDLRPYYQLITSGDGLRNIAGAFIKGSISSLFKDANGVMCMGLGIDIDGANFRLEPLDYFFNASSLIADLGSVSELTMEVAKEFTYNTLKNGYEDQQTDLPNDKSEYFGVYQWEFPTSNIKKELNLVSPYKTAATAIEQARFNQGTAAKAEDTDNDIFVLDIDPSATGGPNNYPVLYRPASMSINGLPFASSWYNIGHSPRRNLLRYGRFIRGFCAFLDAEFINFLTSEKNQDVVMQSPVYGTFDETGDVQVGSLANKLFHPIVFRFKAVMTQSLGELIKNNPYGYFQFTWQGESYQGFLISASQNLALYSPADFTLLAVPNTIIPIDKQRK